MTSQTIRRSMPAAPDTFAAAFGSRADIPEHPLARVDLFRGLNAEHLARVDRAGTVHHVPSGQTLVTEGLTSDTLFCILDGQVRLSVHGPNGPVTVRVAGAGESLPVAALLEPWVAVTTARTLTPTTVFTLPRRDLLALCAGDPAAGMAIYRAAAMFLARRYQSMLERFAGR